MNREIKFRIWANNKFYNKCLVGNTNDSKSDEWTCPMVWLEKTKEWVHCDNGIICQFTGLHDKNGKEIYEGDITYVASEDENAFILWNAETARYGIQFEGWWADFDNFYGRDLEVIGNIYENNELLGGE